MHPWLNLFMLIGWLALIPVFGVVLYSTAVSIKEIYHKMKGKR